MTDADDVVVVPADNDASAADSDAADSDAADNDPDDTADEQMLISMLTLWPQ